MNNRILVMDDDETLLEYYRIIFSSKNAETNSVFFDAELVEHGRAGIDKVKQLKQQNEFFSVAFVDVNMPPGINGIETAKQLLEIDPELYIIFVTAISDGDLENISILEKDNVLYVKKPFSRDEIFQLARTLTAAWNNKRNYLDLLGGATPSVGNEDSLQSLVGIGEKVSQMLADVSAITKNVEQLATLTQGFQSIQLQLEKGNDGSACLPEQYVKAMELGIGSLDEMTSNSLKKSADHLMLQLRLMTDDVFASK